MQTITPSTTEIAFIGCGVMGSRMAARLQEAGFKLHIFTRTASRARALIAGGGVPVESPAQAAARAGLVFTIVGFPHDVEEVYFGSGGILEGAAQGTVLIDMTTSRPELAARIFDSAAAKGISALDAPVSGGDVGAARGTLSIMVGGDRKSFDLVYPILEIMGSNIVYQGGAGCGQHAKMCNQIAIASTMLGVCEALQYAVQHGLDPETVLQSISGGAAVSWSLTHLAPRMIVKDERPGFFIKHFVKDLSIALEEVQRQHGYAPGLELARTLYQEMISRGYGDLGTQALMRLYQQKNHTL